MGAIRLASTVTIVPLGVAAWPSSPPTTWVEHVTKRLEKLAMMQLENSATKRFDIGVLEGELSSIVRALPSVAALEEVLGRSGDKATLCRAATELIALYNLLNLFAPLAGSLGAGGCKMMARLAKGLYGRDAQIIESSQGQYGLYTSGCCVTPRLVAHLPTTQPLPTKRELAMP